MTDPAGLKLPLHIEDYDSEQEIVTADHECIVKVLEPLEASGYSMQHLAEVIVTALTADAENQAIFAACDYHHGPEVTVCTKCGWTADAEKEVRGG